MRKRAFYLVPILAALFAVVFVSACMSVAPKEAVAKTDSGVMVNPAPDKGCLGCHEGIEKFTDIPDMADLSCTDCHMGNANGDSKDTAHKACMPTQLTSA